MAKRNYNQRKMAALSTGFLVAPLLMALLLGLLAFGMASKSALAQEKTPFANQGAHVSDALAQQLTKSREPVSFLIILRDQVDAASFVAEPTVRAASRNARATALYHELTARALQSQAPLRAWLDAQGIPYHAHYLVNMIEVEGDQALALALQQRPEVDRLVANPLVTNALSIPLGPEVSAWPRTFESVVAASDNSAADLPYGLDFTHAPAVWAMGYKGQGIVIASQDTGVQWDHPALQAAYRGLVTSTVTNQTYLPLIIGTDTATSTVDIAERNNDPLVLSATTNTVETVNHVYNWYDAWGLQGRPVRCVQDAQVPCDDHGHGTHTVGTMVGDNTVQGGTLLGMAPDAKWIGCRNMRNGDGTPASYTACFEFFLAPFPQGGDPFTDGQPELAPNIINNSWGCPASEGCDAESLRQVVETMRAAGQMVVASAGNDGPVCSSVGNPISMHDAVFSIGAHNSNGDIAGFSSRGPVTADGSGRRKPDLSAPGVSVVSAALGGGTTSLSGTSMASPHVAGAVALLWSAVPELIGNMDLTEQILIKSATPVPANNCGEGATAVVPNNTYGYGRLNILAAVQMAQAPASLAVAVVDEAAQPVAEQVITATDQLTGYHYQATTAFNGIARIGPIYAGVYRVAALDHSAVQTVTLEAAVKQQVQLTITTAISTTYLP